MIIYHGSDHIIKNPNLNESKLNNDYGKGFYCTENEELGKEWACKNNKEGFLNSYKLNLNNLKILDLSKRECSILNWIAILIKNRIFDTQFEIEDVAKEYLINNYYIDLKEYDVVIGYRADDSYFDYAKSFISNALPLSKLEKAMKLGNLGMQIVIISENAFKNIEFIESQKVDKLEYYLKFKSRDDKARKEYRENIKKSGISKDDLFIADLIRGNTK